MGIIDGMFAIQTSFNDTASHEASAVLMDARAINAFRATCGIRSAFEIDAFSVLTFLIAFALVCTRTAMAW